MIIIIYKWLVTDGLRNDIRCIRVRMFDVIVIRVFAVWIILNPTKYSNTRTTIPTAQPRGIFFELTRSERDNIIVAIAFVNLKIVRRKLCHTRGIDKEQIHLFLSSWIFVCERKKIEGRSMIHASGASCKRHYDDLSHCVYIRYMPIIYNNIVQNCNASHT